MRLGVMGGTFDPVHMGHLVLAEEAREQLGLDKVLFVPAGQPWRKAGRDVSSPEHRLAMLQLAVGERGDTEVSAIEVDRPGPSYTVETLAQLKEQGPDTDLFFILGEDALLDLLNWREPERIAELATLAVVRRHENKYLRVKTEGSHPRPVWLSMPRIDVSASEIRERVRAGRSIRYLVPEAVEDYIRAKGLYR